MRTGAISSMKYTLLAVVFALATVILSFYAMIFPTWFQQHYKDTTQSIDVVQGFGIWSFRSTSELHSNPFYASKTNYKYSSLCAIQSGSTYPNWMLGAGVQYQDALCSKKTSIIQVLSVLSSTLSLLILFASIYAVYLTEIGFAERFVSYGTLISSLLVAAAMLLWGWSIQQNIYKVDPISSQYSSCKSLDTSTASNAGKHWDCWFYGPSFWVALGCVVSASLTGYVSSLGKSEKLRTYRKDYERNLQLAIQASMSEVSGNIENGSIRIPFSSGENARISNCRTNDSETGSSSTGAGIVGLVYTQKAGRKPNHGVVTPSAEEITQTEYIPGNGSISMPTAPEYTVQRGAQVQPPAVPSTFNDYTRSMAAYPPSYANMTSPAPANDRYSEHVC